MIHTFCAFRVAGLVAVVRNNLVKCCRNDVVMKNCLDSCELLKAKKKKYWETIILELKIKEGLLYTKYSFLKNIVICLSGKIKMQETWKVNLARSRIYTIVTYVNMRPLNKTLNLYKSSSSKSLQTPFTVIKSQVWVYPHSDSSMKINIRQETYGHVRHHLLEHLPLVFFRGGGGN